MRNADGTPKIKLEVALCDQGRSIIVTFSTELSAIEYMDRRASGGYAFFEVMDAPIDNRYVELINRLYPTCEHGMSLHLCSGPEHYPADDMIEAPW